MADKSKPEAWTGERCFITELVNDAEWPAFSLARCRVEPGVTTELHALSVLEFYVVERGSGRMRIGDAPPFDDMWLVVIERTKNAAEASLLINDTVDDVGIDDPAYGDSADTSGGEP